MPPVCLIEMRSFCRDINDSVLCSNVRNSLTFPKLLTYRWKSKKDHLLDGTVDGKNPANQLRLEVFSRFFLQVLLHPRSQLVLAGFLNHQQYFRKDGHFLGRAHNQPR